MKKVKSVKPVKKTSHKHIFNMTDEDFSRENFIEGGVIRPAILMASFFAYVFAMMLLLIGNLKWGGSLVIFSFILNMYSIYTSLGDKPSIFKNLNITFKLVLLLSEVIALAWVMSSVITTPLL